MGKDKKKDKSLNESKIEDKSLNESKIGEENGEEMSYEDRLKHVSIIAKPMANKKLAKKVTMKGLDTVESLSGVARGSISKIFLVLLEGPKVGLLQPNLNKIFRVL